MNEKPEKQERRGNFTCGARPASSARLGRRWCAAAGLVQEYGLSWTVVLVALVMHLGDELVKLVHQFRHS
jgi:hypothetical protein